MGVGAGVKDDIIPESDSIDGLSPKVEPKRKERWKIPADTSRRLAILSNRQRYTVIP